MPRLSVNLNIKKPGAPHQDFLLINSEGGATFRTKFRWGERVRARDGSAARIAELDVLNVEEGY